jgi:hypothetical protein
VVSQLQQQFKIEPCFTQLVWQKLEEQNQEFFKAYYTRLKLKDQIVLFNHLLDEQVKMFGRMPHGGHIMPGIPPSFSETGPSEFHLLEYLSGHHLQLSCHLLFRVRHSSTLGRTGDHLNSPLGLPA